MPELLIFVIGEKKEKKMKSRLHETGTYKNLQMEIIAYREAIDIDVEFSNGFILQHTRYYNFQHRIFPTCVIRYHETSTALNGWS